MARTEFKSVEAYIRAQPPAARAALERVRSVIQKALPAAEETISYRIPTYRLGGRAVIYFAAWKEHYSIYPCTAAVKVAFRRELARYDVSKGTIRFPLSKPVPARLIAGIAKTRAKEAHG